SHFSHNEFDDSSISSDRILCIANKNGNIFVGTDHGLNEILKKDASYRFRHFFHDEDPSSISNDIILSLYDTGNSDDLWVGTIDGLNRARLAGDDVKWDFRKYRFTPGTSLNKNEKNAIVYSYLNSYGENSVRGIWKRNEHELWLATDKGLKILDPANGNFSAYHSDPSDPRSLSAELCLCFCPDRSGNLWIGTMVGGINKTDLKPAKFPLIQTDFGNPYNLSSNNIRSVFVDSKGNWWVGTLGGGLNRMDRAKGKFERIVHKSKDPGQDFDPENVWAISEDAEHLVWIGTSNGLYRFDPANDKFTAYTHEAANERSLSNNIVRSILPDSKGNLWVGTESGLDLLDHATGKFQRFLHSAGNILSISNNTVWTVKEFKGTLWVGTDDGLNRINVEKNGKITFTRFNSTANKNSLSNRSVRAVYCDKKGTIWVGTNNGLNRYDEQTNSFQRFSEEDGLSNAFIYSILGDEEDDLWISTNFGISHYIRSEKKFRNYDKLDGLQNNEFNTGAYFMAKGGELFFGGPDGLNHFFPAKVKDNTAVPPVVITGIKVFGEEMQRNIEASEVNDITLHYDQNVLSFEFASLDLTQPEKNQYAYQLKGFDKQVIKAGNRRFVSYTNLDPGEYTFTVLASNNDGVWNEKGKSIHITIVPPFWKTWWFYAACTAFLVFSSWFIIQTRINRLRKTQVYLEKQVSLKTKELREEKETVESQKKLIEKKNQNITSSIHYAKRIQEAILPIRENFNELVPEAFIFFRPKDIVSGDFYW
ncbi:MAG TPA: two-component regulator propeller domain-containing protein, partial [Bacteroidia bacterium]